MGDSILLSYVLGLEHNISQCPTIKGLQSYVLGLEHVSMSYMN